MRCIYVNVRNHTQMIGAAAARRVNMVEPSGIEPLTSTMPL